jgi:serine/threonine-protein kinase
MGVIYLAHHAILGRRAAVKVLLPRMSKRRGSVVRFFNEARAAAAIHHPSIVEIFDFGYLPETSAYIAMEFLEGESLSRRRWRFGRLDPTRAVALVRQIAGALAAAHDCGIVHRDLKPDNIFVVPDPEVPGGERIKILDFGIAKLASNSEESSYTQPGDVLGTPRYISPEQCRGFGGVDGRADLYTLGCVLYELVCGRPPFVVDGARELIAHHLYFEPEPPRAHVPAIPRSLEQLILWLLRKEPLDRPQSARELVEAIDQIGWLAGDDRVSVQLAPEPAASVTTQTELSTASRVRQSDGCGRRG